MIIDKKYEIFTPFTFKHELTQFIYNLNLEKMKIFRLIEMALFAVLMCVSFVACSSDEIDKEDLSSYHKTDLKVNGMKYLVRLEYSDYTPDMAVAIWENYGWADFHVNGVREDGLAVELSGLEIPTPLNSYSNIGKYTKLLCCLWCDIASHYEYSSGNVTIQDNGNGLTIKFSNAVYNLAEADASEELKKHSKQTLNGTMLITEDKVYRRK